MRRLISTGGRCLRSLLAAQPFQPPDNLRRPPRHFLLPQGAIIRLKLRPNQERICLVRNGPAAKDFNRDETSQFFKSERFHGLLDLFEDNRVLKYEREVAFDPWILRQRLVS